MSQSQVPTLPDCFAKLEDPRVERTRLHPFGNILFIALCAVLSGANDFVAMEKFGKSRRAWLEKYLDLRNDIPSHDTFGRVFAALESDRFVDCFVDWAQAAHVATAGRVIGIDGKTARATLDRAKNKSPLHVVSAWATENRLVLGQQAVDSKSNEITAIPSLLEVLELTGAIVTIDAMGCQKEIAAKIREKGADYVLAVKGNQEHLEEDISNAFVAADEGTGAGRPSEHESRERGHGREDFRWTQALPVPKDLRHAEAWKDLQSIARVIRVYKQNGKEALEARYFISSLPPDAPRLAKAVRQHWGVENGLHWVLDMYFAEDRGRARTDNAAANLALLRRWVLSLLRQDKSVSGGIEKKRLQAGWSDEVREKLLDLL